jgi:HEAT repeat protein
MSKYQIEELIKQCKSDDPSLQVQAIMELRDREIHEAVPILLSLLNSPDEGVRSVAAEALGFLGTEDSQSVGSALIKLLDDPEPLVRDDALWALVELRYTPALKSVRCLLQNDTDLCVRASAAEALGLIGNNRDIEILELTLQRDPDDIVRSYAALSVGLLGSTSLIPNLEMYLREESDLHVRIELLGASYRLGKAEALNSLIDLTETVDMDSSVVLLNVFEDLVTRKLPPTISTDAENIRDSLNALARRFPLYKTHVQGILSALEQTEER